MFDCLLLSFTFENISFINVIIIAAEVLGLNNSLAVDESYCLYNCSLIVFFVCENNLLSIQSLQINIGVIHPKMPPHIVFTWGARGSLDWTTEKKVQGNQY